MENLDLLIEIAIYVGALVFGFLMGHLGTCFFDLIQHTKLLFVYLKTKKNNQLHEKDNAYFKEFNKVRLMDGKEVYSFEQYESHFIDGKFYF